jgi:phenylacetate-CoA ligase
MSVLGSLAFSLTHRLRRSDSLRLYHAIRDEPWQSTDEVRRRQFERLAHLLGHAEATVPYYRELFRSLGITSRDIRSFADFASFPLLTKDILRERMDDLVSDAVDRSTLLPHHSGGSTGVPVTFYRDRQYLDASDAGTYRNLAQCGWKPGDMVAFFWGFNKRLDAMPRWQFELRQRLRRFYQFDPFKSGRAEMASWVRTWRRVQPVVALGYASTVARFAEYVLQEGIILPPIKGVFTTAEKLYPVQRTSIGRAFGCHVFDLYGSSEVQNIAAECPAGSMHVNADYCVLETAPEGDALAQPLILTSLKSYAMPFIRYRNEDCGRLSSETCSCGRGFPLMHLDVARLSDNFVLPGSKVVHGEFFTHLMYGSEGIASFQFHQTAPDRIVLRVVPGPGSVARRAEAIRSAIQQIRALSESLIHVDVEEVDAIPLSSAGKHRFTRSDVALPSEGGRVTSPPV